MLKVRRGQGGDSTTADHSGITQHTGQSRTWHWCQRYTHWIIDECPNNCCRCYRHKPRNRRCCHRRCCRPCPPTYIPYNPYPYYPPGPIWIGGWGTTNDYYDSGDYWITSAGSGVTNTGSLNTKFTIY